MPRPVSWFRRFRGKVWHVSFTDDALATCGKARPADAEYVGERAPVNARVCGDCVSMALHLYALAQAAQMGDPRTPERGLIGVPLPEVGDGVIDAEIYCGSCDHVEHIGPCTLVEGSRITKPCDCYVTGEWPCGSCGHPNLDHDCDDGTCTVTNDNPGVSWGTCPCRGLKRAG